MDLSDILVWIVGISILGLLLRARQLRRHEPSWLLVAAVIAGLLGSLLVLAPERAGLIAAAVWFPLVAIPSLAARFANSRAARRRFAAAASWARVAAVFHPTAGYRQRPALYGAAATIQGGDIDGGRAVLEELARSGGGVGAAAGLLLLQLDRRWADIAARYVPRRGGERPADVWVRSLGELGDVDAMLAASVRRPGGGRAQADVLLAALAGRPDLVERLYRGPLRRDTPADQTFWLGTARQVAGDHDGARAALRSLLGCEDHLIRRAARARLDDPLAPAECAQLSPPGRAGLAALEARVEELTSLGTLTAPVPRPPPRLTWTLVLILVGVFLAELPGGSTDLDNLRRMGAMIVPWTWLDGELWRLFTATFLHYGAVHLVMNALGIWLFGRWLEPILGWPRLLLAYLVCGSGALALVLVWATAISSEPGILIGASAGLMGLVGVAIAILHRRHRVRPSPVASRQLVVLLAVVALQVVFDLVTPQVSGAAHLAGLALGLAFGALYAGGLARRWRGTPGPRSESDRPP